MTNFLRHPWSYGFFQDLLGRSRSRTRFLREHLRPVAGERLLDLGCGTGEIVDYLPDLDYWGLDASPDYIGFAKKKFAGRATFVETDLCGASWPVPGPFDRAMASGLLHHLPDDAALAVLKNARRLLKRGAKLVTLDGCYEAGQPFFAKALLRADRGKYVRDEKGYMALARSVFERVEARMERRLLRVPYSHLIMEMTAD